MICLVPVEDFTLLGWVKLLLKGEMIIGKLKENFIVGERSDDLALKLIKIRFSVKMISKGLFDM